MVELTVIILLLGSAVIYRKLRNDCLIHPALWFGLSWLVAISSYEAMCLFGLRTIDGYLLNKLLAFVIVTEVAFVAASICMGSRGIIKLSWINKAGCFDNRIIGCYLCFALIGLCGSLVNWMSVSGTLSYSDAVRQQHLVQIPAITARTWYLYLATFPAAVVGGFLIGFRLMRGSKGKVPSILASSIPLISGYFWMLGTGGRQVLGFVVLYYFVGACSLLREMWPRKRKEKRRFFRAALFATLLVVSLALVVGLTGKERLAQQGKKSLGELDGHPYLSPVAQFVQYMGLSIVTYQTYGLPDRRDLSATGPVTLAGFLDFGIRYILGFRALTVLDTNPERALASKGYALAFATRNIYYDFEADFGLCGAIGIVCVLVVVSVGIFWRRKSLDLTKLTSLVPLTICLMFWAYSHQFSLLMFDTLKWTLISFVCWDCGLVVFKHFVSVVLTGPRREKRSQLDGSPGEKVKYVGSEIGG